MFWRLWVRMKICHNRHFEGAVILWLTGPECRAGLNLTPNSAFAAQYANGAPKQLAGELVAQILLVSHHNMHLWAGYPGAKLIHVVIEGRAQIHGWPHWVKQGDLPDLTMPGIRLPVFSAVPLTVKKCKSVLFLLLERWGPVQMQLAPYAGRCIDTTFWAILFPGMNIRCASH
jgi:hypothetical protein